MKNSQTFTRNWFSKHGITARIVILFLLLVIIPFFMMAGFVVMVFRDYNVTSLGNSAMDSMSSVGYQISRELKTRKESSMFAYYNDIVAMLDEGQITEQERQFIEKKINLQRVFNRRRCGRRNHRKRWGSLWRWKLLPCVIFYERT